MIGLTTKGPWRQLNSLLKSYDKRFKYVQQELGISIVENLLARLKEEAPEGLDYAVYVKSLEAVQLMGEKGVLSFAVVSRNVPMKMGTLLSSNEVGRTVVYLHPTASGMSSPAIRLLASVNPWPADLVPNGINRKDVTLVHRLVLKDEVEFVRTAVVDFISENRSELRSLGLRWGKIEPQETAVEGMETLPDYMSLALRAEFGINAESQPHWRPAIRWIITKLGSLVKNNDKIREALRDPLFRDHTMQKTSGLPEMPMRQFEKENRVFQEKVLGK